MNERFNQKGLHALSTLGHRCCRSLSQRKISRALQSRTREQWLRTHPCTDARPSGFTSYLCDLGLVSEPCCGCVLVC